MAFLQWPQAFDQDIEKKRQPKAIELRKPHTKSH